MFTATFSTRTVTKSTQNFYNNHRFYYLEIADFCYEIICLKIGKLPVIIPDWYINSLVE